MLLEASDDGGFAWEKQFRPVVSLGHGCKIGGFALVVEDRCEKGRNGFQHFRGGRPVVGPE